MVVEVAGTVVAVGMVELVTGAVLGRLLVDADVATPYPIRTTSAATGDRADPARATVVLTRLCRGAVAEGVGVVVEDLDDLRRRVALQAGGPHVASIAHRRAIDSSVVSTLTSRLLTATATA